ncbi:hypothetical protein O181_042341 [Austropuccinia psidii MF-1]|uniref:Uncharacterized protein n=1 Tax=Austropuccinia psidii MF-1 TaxID=1389203 RepID=A0A9Q3DLG9_9BASI|nr:hypothetical protein [Austropuccinia psidii MF-1]
MGSSCFKAKRFKDQGNRLTSTSNSNTLNDTQKPKTEKVNPNSSASLNTAQVNNRQEAAAAAAESRAQAAKARGTKGGELSKALAQQPADGGRVNQAITTGNQIPKNPLVWD